MRLLFMCSVYAGKTSTPRSGGRIQGRRNVTSADPVPAVRQKSQSSNDDPPWSPVSAQSEAVPPDNVPQPLQRTSSWQSSASGGSSKSGGGSSRSGPIPKPRSTVNTQAGDDEVDLTSSYRPSRDVQRRPVPEALAQKPGLRSQSSPGDRIKSPPEPPPPLPVKEKTYSHNGVVSGRSGTPMTHHQHQVDRSPGSMGPPLSAFADRAGLVFDMRSRTAYRRGRLLGKV